MPEQRFRYIALILSAPLENDIFKGALNSAVGGAVIITANELKRKGVSYVSSLLEKFENVFISVRGRKKYVILKVEDYERLKELELENAIREAEKDIKEGRYTVETAEEHFKRLGI